MAAGEDEPEPVVGHAPRRPPGVRVERRRRGRRLVRLDEQGELAAQRDVAADPVDGAAAGGRRQPGAGTLGDAVPGPGRECVDVRLLGALLGEVEVAGDAHRRGEHEGPLATVRVRQRVGDGDGDGH